MSEKIKLGTGGNWGVKPNGLLAFNDENNIFKAIELSSSRASSGTYVAQNGLIATAQSGVPRIDWTNGVGELLLEPQSTNLITYSEDLSNPDWNKGISTTITLNNSLSPNGSVNATRVQMPIGSGTYCSFGISVTSGQTYTFSFYAKNNGGGFINFGFGSTSTGVGDLSNTILTEFSDEWVRYSITYTAASTTTIYVGIDNNLNTQNVDAYFYGFQCENLSYMTSIIPTNGSTATRIADAVTGNSSLGQVINSTEGVLYFDIKTLFNDGSVRYLSISDNSVNNRITLYYASGNNIVAEVFSGGVQQANLSHALTDATAQNKIAIKWSLNDCSLWVNGVEENTDASATMPIGLSKISFDNGVGGSDFYGRTRELKVYDTALTDAELTTLTTL